MHFNKKGEGGFMEAMVAVMIVIISLTAFLSFLVHSSSQSSDDEKELPLNVLDGVSVAGGKIVADIEDDMAMAMERYGYIGMRIEISSADSILDSKVVVNAGYQDSDIIRSKCGTIIVKADDGRSVPLNYVMAVWS